MELHSQGFGEQLISFLEWDAPGASILKAADYGFDVLKMKSAILAHYD